MKKNLRINWSKKVFFIECQKSLLLHYFLLLEGVYVNGTHKYRTNLAICFMCELQFRAPSFLYSASIFIYHNGNWLQDVMKFKTWEQYLIILVNRIFTLKKFLLKTFMLYRSKEYSLVYHWRLFPMFILSQNGYNFSHVASIVIM